MRETPVTDIIPAVMPDHAPTLPEVRMNLIRPRQPAMGRVISNDLCMSGKSASFVKHLVLDVSGTPLAGNFLAGQSFGVIPPGTNERGRPHKVRLYSVACPSWGEDGGGNLVSTTPKRLIDEYLPRKATDDPTDHRLFLGVCSNYLCDVREGDEVAVTGPNGKRFLLPEDMDAHNYLFIATGTGIAPFRGMLMELFDGRGSPTRARAALVMGTPYTTDLLYEDLFQRIQQEHPNFAYHTAISRESDRLYVGGLIDRDIDKFAELIEDPRTLIYVCGLEGMQFGLFKALARHGLAAGYLNIKEGLAEQAPDDWHTNDMKRQIKPTPRCMLEVY